MLTDRVGIWMQDGWGELHPYATGKLEWWGGWPTLYVENSSEIFVPPIMPHNLQIRLIKGELGTVFSVWNQMRDILKQLAITEREVQRQKEFDDLDRAQQREIVETDEEERERAHNRSINNQIALEIDNDQID